MIKKRIHFMFYFLTATILIYILHLHREREIILNKQQSNNNNKMPLKIFEAHIQTFDTVFQEFKKNSPNHKANFILFLADVEPSTGKSWCPDCVRAEPVIYKKLEESSGDIALLRAYVGDRPTWRNAHNHLRVDSMFKLTGVPTLIRWENDAITGRLEDHEAHVEKKIDALLA